MPRTAGYISLYMLPIQILARNYTEGDEGQTKLTNCTRDVIRVSESLATNTGALSQCIIPATIGAVIHTLESAKNLRLSTYCRPTSNVVNRAFLKIMYARLDVA